VQFVHVDEPMMLNLPAAQIVCVADGDAAAQM
jgi:hypothetical protein